MAFNDTTLYIKLHSIPPRKHCIYIADTKQLILCREIIPVYSGIPTNHSNTLCGQNKQTVNVNTSGTNVGQGIATRYGLDGPGIESRWGQDFSAPVQTGPGAHPASYTMGTGSFQGLKRPGRGVVHPPHLAPRLKEE